MADKEKRTPPDQAQGDKPNAQSAEMNNLLRGGFGSKPDFDKAGSGGASMTDMLRASLTGTDTQGKKSE